MRKTLDETYERALMEIDEEMRQYAQRLFQCLAVSIRPLRVEELAEILAVQFDAGALPEFNPDWRLGDAEGAVLSVCSNLISVVDVNGSQVVQFSHFSVKEFLSSDRLAVAREDLSGYHIVPHLAHAILAQASLSVLLQLDDRIDKDSIRNFPLSGYAAQHWVDHGQFGNVSSTIQVAMERLFNPDQPYFSAWVWIYDIDSPWNGSMSTMHPERPQAAPLYYAVLCGFPGLIEHLITTYPGDVDAKPGSCKSPLLAAFIKGDIDTASLLLQQGADANVRDEHHTSPLHQASRGGRIDIVRLLLDHDADVDLRGTSDATPLGWASRTGQINVSRLLLQRGANVNSQNAKGKSPLHGAAKYGHLEVVRLLIESGATIDPQAKTGWTPLYMASISGYVKIAELLINKGADARSRDNNDETPLHIAAFNGHLDLVKLLLGCGTDPNVQNDNNKTPLDLASDNGKLEVANFLSQLTTPLGRTVEPTVSSINSQRQSRHPSVVTRPQPREEDVKHSKDEQPSMHTASINGQIDVVRSFLGRGSDVDERNSFQQTALALASRHGRLQVANLLIESGADVNSRDNTGWTPLHSASRNGHLDIVRLLLDHGADLNARQRNQRTALDAASCHEHLAIAELLIERGADVNVCDGYGWTPKQGALVKGYHEMAELLSRYGAHDS